MTPDVAEAMAIVGQLWTAGKEADRALLDRVVALGSVATTLLIEMALDESLHNAAETSPDVWAPLHAIRLLGELAAAEAVEPLFPLFAWDDDYLAIDLPEAYGRIGQPAMSALRRLVGDRGGDIWARVRATSALEKVVDYHPELRGDVVATLLAHLDSDETDTADIDILHGFVVSSLVELRAEEAIGSIRRAFEENRVDLMVIEESTVQETFGLPRETWSTLPRERRLSSFRDRLLAIPPPRCMAEERAGRARDGPGAPRAASAASEARA